MCSGGLDVRRLVSPSGGFGCVGARTADAQKPPMCSSGVPAPCGWHGSLPLMAWQLPTGAASPGWLRSAYEV